MSGHVAGDGVARGKSHWSVVGLAGTLAVVVCVSAIAIHHRLSLRSRPTNAAVAEREPVDLPAEGVRDRSFPSSAPLHVVTAPPAGNEPARGTDTPGTNTEASDPVLYPGGVPNPNLTPQQAAKYEVDRNLKQLSSSGAASGPLTANGLRVVEDWKLMTKGTGTEFSDFRCYKDGCSAVSTHADMSAAMSAGDQVLHSSQFFTWPGRKFRSGPIETSSGKVQLLWILYSNDQQTARKEETP